MVSDLVNKDESTLTAAQKAKVRKEQRERLDFEKQCKEQAKLSTSMI